MNGLIFVDKELRVLESEPKEERFAVDLGQVKFFAGEVISRKPVHLFVSALPLVKSVDLQQALLAVYVLRQKNAACCHIDLLSLGQLELVNKLGKEVGFCISDTWTSSYYQDWHGRIDARYSLKDGRPYMDWGNRVTDVYLSFSFIPGCEKALVL